MTEHFSGHDRLDVYRLSIEYVAIAFDTSRSLVGLHRHARDQWLRASQSIPLRIAEGNRKRSLKDRANRFSRTITSTSTAMLSTSTKKSRIKAMQPKASIGRFDLRQSHLLGLDEFKRAWSNNIVLVLSETVLVLVIELGQS